MRKNVMALFLVSILCISTISVALSDKTTLIEENSEMYSTTPSSVNCSNVTRSIGDHIHVDNQLGNNSNPGTLDCPVETVVKAIEIAIDNDTITIHEGVYHESVIISGFQNLTIHSAIGERVVFDGTRSIADDLHANWTLSTGGIHEVDLGINAWQVFMDYEEQVPARWPNANFSDSTVLNQSHHWAHGTIGDGGTYSNGELQDGGGTAGASNGLVASGIDPTGAIAILNVASFQTWSRTVNSYDSANATFTYDEVPKWKTKHHNYFLEGMRELIDVSGEWWFSNNDDKLHMMFPNGTNPDTLDIRVKTQAFAFNVTASENITLQGLEFFATTFRTQDCNACAVLDSDLMYPSTSKRGLGISGEDEDDRWISRMDKCSNCLIDNSSFAHTDGTAIEFHGAGLQSHNNTINNTNFESIDWSSSDLPGLMVTVFDSGRDNTFSNNTVHTTGASATISIGDSPQVFYNDISDTGYTQSDGAVVQMMMNEQFGAEVAYNWIHDSEKYGIRMDGPAGGTNTGNNATVHHNVLWDMKTGFMVKGDYHSTHNNTVFGNGNDIGKNQIIVLYENGAGNENSTTSNNAADKIAAHRSNSYSSNPVPGIFISNYNGYQESSGTVESMLVDPANNDFRPNSNSILDNLSAGAYDAADPNPWTAGAIRTWQPMIPPILGCTNATSNNYDSNAGVNDHSCDFDLDDDGIPDIDEIEGCTDSTANNYDVNATDDDGSCDYDFDDDGIPDIDEIEGCTDSTANNYDVNATDDDGSCDFDLDDDGIPDIDEIEGCTDSTANNYDVNATDDDGSCDFDLDDDGVPDIDEIEGCTDSTANNYDVNATDDDGSCDFDLDDDGVPDIDEIEGCTDSTANNYDVNATDDDGSCDFDLDDDGVPDIDEIEGCTDSTANNYDVNATDDDGSCDFDLDDDGVPDIDEIEGCTDSTANNFDVNATDDDGSCDYDLDDDGVLDVDEVLGCINSTANNFDVNATDDDGSCDSSEPIFDTDNDGFSDDLDNCPTLSGVDNGCPVTQGKDLEDADDISKLYLTSSVIIILVIFLLFLLLRKRKEEQSE